MGIWETFCPICGLPIGYNYPDKPKNLLWLNNVTIVNAKNQTIQFNLYEKYSEYDIAGTIIYKNVCYVLSKYLYPKNNHRVSQQDMLKATGLNILVDGKEIINFITPQENAVTEIIESYAMHTACYDLIKKQFNYELKYCTIKQITSDDFGILNRKLYGKEYLKFSDTQFFDFEGIMDKNNTSAIFITQNPLINSANKHRIINIWTNIVNKLKNKKCRPSPSMTATFYNVGTIKYGNNGKLWIIKKTANRNMWVSLNKDNVGLYLDRIDKLNNAKNKSKGKGKGKIKSKSKSKSKSKKKNINKISKTNKKNSKKNSKRNG